MTTEIAVKERPILFSAPMVRALLDGRKTQTRRTNGLENVNEAPDIWTPYGVCTSDGFGELGYMAKKTAKGKPGATFTTHQLQPQTMNVCPQLCPYGKPGDRLWVRETWQYCGFPNVDLSLAEMAFYRADRDEDQLAAYNGKWRPSIFMPRWASRITLEITEVRVQRLQDISQRDAAAEGIKGPYSFDHTLCPGPLASLVFEKLWESIHGEGSWDANPWLWCVSFKRVPVHG